MDKPWFSSHFGFFFSMDCKLSPDEILNKLCGYIAFIFYKFSIFHILIWFIHINLCFCDFFSLSLSLCVCVSLQYRHWNQKRLIAIEIVRLFKFNKTNDNTVLISAR